MLCKFKNYVFTVKNRYAYLLDYLFGWLTKELEKFSKQILFHVEPSNVYADGADYSSLVLLETLADAFA